MSLDAPEQKKMMTAPPAKKEFHFAGGNIWRNLTILAENIEEATKEWLAKRKLISGSEAGTATTPAVPTSAPEQSTASLEPKPDENAVQ